MLVCFVYLISCFCFFFFFNQKTAYEMRISDWSSDVCSSDLGCIDGYGNTTAITKLMEGLDDRGAAVANYASYTALAAAIDTGVVAPGRWATDRKSVV